MQYCQLHGTNPTHGTADCFQLNCQKKRAKEFEVIQRHKKQEKTRILYKELNAFINAKVEQALKKKGKAKKAKKIEIEIAVNAFERFRNLEVADTDEEGRKPEAVKNDSDDSGSDADATV